MAKINLPLFTNGTADSTTLINQYTTAIGAAIFGAPSIRITVLPTTPLADQVYLLGNGIALPLTAGDLLIYLNPASPTGYVTFTPPSGAVVGNYIRRGSGTIDWIAGTTAYKSTATITRSTSVTPYISNSVYGSTFELVGFGGENFVILTDISIVFNISLLPSGMGGFLLYLYSSAPSSIPDQATFSIPSSDLPIILTVEGIYLKTVKLASGGGLVVLDASDINRQLPILPSGSVFGRIVTLNAFTPAAPSETATITSLTLRV